MAIILIDTEGTLFDNTHRLDLFKSSLWESYEDACLEDTVIEPTAKFIRTIVMDTHWKTLLVTPRYERFRERTTDILVREKLYIDGGYFRPTLDKMPKVKEPLLKLGYVEQIREKFPGEELYALEDRDDCVDAYRNAGVTCWQVAPGVMG